jgi:uncharacterized protein
MEHESQAAPEKKLPFNNLFLNTGVVSGLNEWWMYVFGVCACIFGYFVFQMIMIFPLMSAAMSNGIDLDDIQRNPAILFDPAKIGIDKNLLLSLLLGMFVFACLGLYFAVTKMHRKPFKSIITAYDNIRWKRFFFAFGLWGGLIVLLTLGTYLVNSEGITVQFHPANFAILLVISLILLPIQTSTEEFLFRGYLLQGLAQVFKNGIIPLILTSLFFGLLHMENPEAKTFGWALMLPYYSLFGFFLGAITLLDEGLELALGVHCANNLISGLLVTTPNTVIKTDAIFSTTIENPPAELLSWFVMAGFTFIIFWLKYRWKNFNLLIK